MDTILAILDQDEEYLKCLIDYMKSKKEILFSIVVFSDGDAYMNYESTNLVSILLYQEGHFSSIVEKSTASKKNCFRESKTVNKDDISGIFKYQSVNQIMKEILRLLDGNKEIGILHMGNMQSFVTSVCAPIQESYSSIIALALAYEYSKIKRTLFLSFDPFLPFEIIGTKDNYQGISDVIYYAKQRTNNLNIKIKSLINKKDSLDYISGVAHWSDVSELAESDLEHIMQVVKEQLGYEVIIIDVGIITNITGSLFKNSNYIYEIMSKGRYVKPREKEFRRQLQLKVGEEVMNRLIPIIVPSMDINEDNFSFTQNNELSILAKDLISRNYLNETVDRRAYD